MSKSTLTNRPTTLPHLPLAGGTMTGDIDFGANTISGTGDVKANSIEVANDPTAANQVGDKAYNDDRYLQLSGGTMAGAVDFGANAVSNIADPTADDELGDRSYNDVRYSRKNLILNGAMQLWQVGTSTSTTGSYLADMWYSQIGAGTTTRSRRVDGPTGFRYCNEVKTTDGTSAWALWRYRFEVNDLMRAEGQTVCLSFYAKGEVAASMAMSPYLRYWDGGEDTFTGTYTNLTKTTITNPNISTSWQQYVFTWPMGTINTASGYELMLYTNSNALDTINDYVRITGVQLEIGAEPTSFEWMSMAELQNQCERYYQVGGGYEEKHYTGGDSEDMTEVRTFTNTMRASPTVTLTDYAGTSGKITVINSSTYQNGNDYNVLTVRRGGFFVRKYNNYPVGSVQCGFWFSWVADSRL